MNFLAHMFLSCENAPLLVGNFLGDFLRNREVAKLPEEIQQGVRLHRLIDTYTDQHPIVKQGSARLHHQHGKYAPVLVDIYYDYLLSLAWDSYDGRSLRAFTNQTYETLRDYQHVMPERIADRTERMIKDDWLFRYQTAEGIERTFYFMRRRVSKPELFEGATESLLKNQRAYEAEFKAFFPDVIEYVQKECLC
ncbi:MAG: ACP phosphodiesterase [Bacteroidota bacterium]